MNLLNLLSNCLILLWTPAILLVPGPRLSRNLRGINL
jgi:hypothetical protein